MEDKLKLLYSWLESWHQPNGYGGFLHHAIHGTVNWCHVQLVPSYTYEPLMNGFINLYNSTGNRKWLAKAEDCAQDLINILDDAHQFKYSGFEFAPKGGSIVHTINPLFSFLKLYEITLNTKYLSVVKEVLESVICIYWKGHNLAGPFNMTLIAASAFAEYGRVSGDWRLCNKYGKPCFEIVRNHKVGPEGGKAEGLYYRSENDHSIIFPWYNTVKAIAMLRYGRAINDDYWINEGKNLLKKLKTIIRSDYSYPHSFQVIGGKFVELSDICLVAPVALAFTWMSQEKIMSEKETLDAINNIMSKQTNIGFIPANNGYGWRSGLGVTAWNCFVFELLTTKYHLKDNLCMPLSDYAFSYDTIDIRENNDSLIIEKDGSVIVEIEKRKGLISLKGIDKVNFRIPNFEKDFNPHIVKKMHQRHIAIAYVDYKGDGCWMDECEGTLDIWSPTHYLKLLDDFKVLSNGKQRYSVLAPMLYKLLKPIVYSRLLPVMTKIIHR